MLSISRTRALGTICFASWAIAAASIALAKDEQNQSNQQNQDQQQAQPSQPAGQQLDAPSDEQKQPNQQNVSRDEGTTKRGLRSAPSDSDAQSSANQKQPAQDQSSRAQNKNIPEWPSPQRDESDRSSSQRSNRSDQSQSNQSSRNSQRSDLRYNTPGMPWSDSAPRDQQSRGQQGASLGVNITSSGESQGVVITRVQSDTPAQQMGLRPRDRITSVNGEPVRSADEFISTIRSKNPGDQVELGLVRGGGERTIRGELEAYGQALARNEQPSGNDEFRNYQGIINRGRSNSDQFSSENVSRDAERSAERFSSDLNRGENRQTSFEDRGPSDRPRSGDVDARLARIEQQLDRLTQDVEELRNTIGTAPPSSGLREAASAEFRAQGQQSQPRANAAQPNGETIRKNDRWNTENRFEQGDLPGARERAALEAARRRAEQTGARLQQDVKRDTQRSAPSKNNSQQSAPSNTNPPQTPGQPPTDQPPSDQSK